MRDVMTAMDRLRGLVRSLLATFKIYSNGSFLAHSEAGNSNRVVGLLRMVAKGVK